MWPVRILKRAFHRRRLEEHSRNLAEKCADFANKCAALYYRSAIYVSFTDKAAHEHAIAVNVVHELSHALWERIEGEPLDRNWSNAGDLAQAAIQKFRLFVEGYATYAERMWFLDLYPPIARNFLTHAKLDPASIHFQGLKIIEQLVEKHGTGILLRIPRSWREL